MLGFLTGNRQNDTKLTAPQMTFFQSLVLIDNSDNGADKFLEAVANLLANSLEPEEMAKFVGIILQKRLITVGPEKGSVFSDPVFQMRRNSMRSLSTLFESEKKHKAFTYYLVKAVINKVGYLVEKNREKISAAMIELSIGEKESAKEARLTLIAQFSDIPPPILSMFLFCYRKLIEPFSDATAFEISSVKSEFRKIVIPFFYDALQIKEEVREGRRMSREEMRGFINNSKKVDLFSWLTDKLDECNEHFLPDTGVLRAKWVTTAQDIYTTCDQFFKQQAKIQGLSEIFKKFLPSFNPAAQSTFARLYHLLPAKLDAELQSFMQNDVQNMRLAAVKELLTRSKGSLNAILNGIIAMPLSDDLSSLHRLVEQIRPFQDRIGLLIEIFSQCANNYAQGSPVRVSFNGVICDLYTLLENVIAKLVYNNAAMDEAQVKEELKACSSKVKSIVKTIINDPEFSPLHFLLTTVTTNSEEKQQKLERELDCLLREGADPDLKSTNYKIEQGLLGKLVASLTSSFGSKTKVALSAADLAAYFNNNEIFNRCLKKYSERNVAALRKLTQTSTSLAKSGNSEQSEKTQDVEFELDAQPVVVWKRGRPPSQESPRDFISKHEDKKARRTIDQQL